MAAACLPGMLLAACRTQVPTSPPTQTGLPPAPPTATEFPLPDLESVLRDRRVRSPLATSVEISSTPHPTFTDLPEPVYFISARYLTGTEFAGRVSVFIYSHQEDLNSAWPLMLALIHTPKEVLGVGELAAIDHSDMVFIRCTAITHIKLAGLDPFELRTYAEALDAQMKPHVCLE